MGILVLSCDKAMTIIENLVEEGGGSEDVIINRLGVLLTREQRGPNRGKWMRHGVVDHPEKCREQALDYFTFFA